MKKFILSIIAIFTAFTLAVAPVYAAEKCTLTTVLGNEKCDQDGNKGEGDFNCSCDEDGSSIFHILKLVMNIMTIGIGILGIIGITVVGIQYLTSGSNEEQARKAKKRLFEIVIGLVIYTVFFFILDWLLPSYKETQEILEKDGVANSIIQL